MWAYEFIEEVQATYQSASKEFKEQCMPRKNGTFWEIPELKKVETLLGQLWRFSIQTYHFGKLEEYIVWSQISKIKQEWVIYLTLMQAEIRINSKTGSKLIFPDLLSTSVTPFLHVK